MGLGGNNATTKKRPEQTCRIVMSCEQFIRNNFAKK